MSVFVTVSARTYEELMWRKQQMTDMLKSMDMYVSDCSFQQEDALRTVMPFLQISPKLEKKSKRNVLTSGAASTYMFTSFEMSDDTGVLLGINRHNNSLCIVDLFDTKKIKCQSEPARHQWRRKDLHHAVTGIAYAYARHSVLYHCSYQGT